MDPATSTPDMGKPQSQARHIYEPLLVLSIMIASLYFNRDRNFSIFPSRRSSSRDRYSETARLRKDGDDSNSSSRSTSPAAKEQWQEDSDTSAGGMYLHSRILQKFPFLVEMFYWALNYAAYAMTKRVAEYMYADEKDEVARLAQDHGIQVLSAEYSTILRIFFPVTEVEFQGFFLNGHQTALTVLNQIYSLVHIPGTVA